MRPKNAGTEAKSLQADCATFATVTMVVAVTLTLGLVVNITVPVLRRLGDPEPTVLALTMVALTALAGLLANIFLADALWKAPRLFGRMAEGQFLHPEHGKDARGAGSALMAAGIVAQTATPAALTILTDAPGRMTDFSLEWMAVIGIGVAIWLLGRVLDIAAHVQAENEAIV